MESAYCMAITFLTYLLFEEFCMEDLRDAIKNHEDFSGTPCAFLRFSGHYWPTFLLAVDSGSYSEDAWQAVRSISQSPVRLEFLISLHTELMGYVSEIFIDTGFPGNYPKNPLQVATYFSFENIIWRLLGTRDTDFYFDGKVYGYATFHNASQALAIAIHKSYESIVHLLVDFGANINYRRSRMPLFRYYIYPHPTPSSNSHRQ